MLENNNGGPWFDTLEPYPSDDSHPGRDLAQLIKTALPEQPEHDAGSAAAPVAEPVEVASSPATAGDEWGWLGLDAEDPQTELADSQEVPSSVGESTTDFAVADVSEAIADRFAAVPVSPSPAKSRPQFRSRVPSMIRLSRKRVVLVTGVGAVVVGLTAAVLGVTGADSDRAEGSDAGTQAVAAEEPGGATQEGPGSASCPLVTEGPRLSGSGPGDQSSGPATVLAFNYGYYVLRSANAARAVAAPTAVADAASMQEFIDRLPEGTTHCVQIESRGPDTYAVQVTEIPPDAAPTIFPQIITTTEANGKTWIASIKPAENKQ